MSHMRRLFRSQLYIAGSFSCIRNIRLMSRDRAIEERWVWRASSPSILNFPGFGPSVPCPPSLSSVPPRDKGTLVRFPCRPHVHKCGSPRNNTHLPSFALYTASSMSRQAVHCGSSMPFPSAVLPGYAVGTTLGGADARCREPPDLRAMVGLVYAVCAVDARGCRWMD